ncbi:MAG: hypothetical protein K2N05_04905 [Muribaculaceae bacterium]|nr:hypothetical protein [Muribaculaceae bacterium]
MKKLMTILTAFLCVILSSCGGSKAVDPKDVAEKLSAGEPLTEQDYTAMIDYCADYAQKAQPFFDVLNSGVDTTSKEYADATNSLADMESKAVYLDAFRNAIRNATPEQLGEENVRLIEKSSKLEAFPLPGVPDSTLMNPDVVGDIVDMPSSDSSGVIADGDGEVVLAK